MGLDCAAVPLLDAGKHAWQLNPFALWSMRVSSALFGNLDALRGVVCVCVCYYFKQLAYKSSIFLFFRIIIQAE